MATPVYTFSVRGIAPPEYTITLDVEDADEPIDTSYDFGTVAAPAGPATNMGTISAPSGPELDFGVLSQ